MNALPRRPRPRPPTAATAPRRLRRWAVAGGLLGTALALMSQWPAAWLAGAMQRATDGRLQLAEAQGSVWSGSALPVLTGGPGSRDASVLPSRLHWQLRLHWNGVSLSLSQPCCMPEPVTLRWQADWRQQALSVEAPGARVGSWPAAWLQGLGAPWNTLQPGGQLRLSSRLLTLRREQGQWQLGGQAELEWLQATSRLVPLDTLGSYRLQLTGRADAPARVQLQTLEGVLQLQGQGEWRGQTVHFRGQAEAAAGQEPVLNNLLNIIGRRQGARSVISIG